MVSHSDEGNEEMNSWREESWFPEEMLRARLGGHLRATCWCHSPSSQQLEAAALAYASLCFQGKERPNHLCSKYCHSGLSHSTSEPFVGRACVLLSCSGSSGPHCHRTCRPRSYFLCKTWLAFREMLAVVCPSARGE